MIFFITFLLGELDFLFEELGDSEVAAASFTSSFTDSDATFAGSLALKKKQKKLYVQHHRTRSNTVTRQKKIIYLESSSLSLIALFLLRLFPFTGDSSVSDKFFPDAPLPALLLKVRDKILACKARSLYAKDFGTTIRSCSQDKQHSCSCATL